MITLSVCKEYNYSELATKLGEGLGGEDNCPRMMQCGGGSPLRKIN
jgi:hypothetical protein